MSFPRGFLLKSTRKSASPPAGLGETAENSDPDDARARLDHGEGAAGIGDDGAGKQRSLAISTNQAAAATVESLTDWDDLSYPSGIPVPKEQLGASIQSIRSIGRLKYTPTVQRRPSTSRRRAQTLQSERSVSGGRFLDAADLPSTGSPGDSQLLGTSNTVIVDQFGTVRSALSASSNASLSATTSSLGSSPNVSPAAIVKASVASVQPARSTDLNKFGTSVPSPSANLVGHDERSIETPSRLPVLVRRRARGTCADGSPVSASEPSSSSPASTKSEKIKNRKGTPFKMGTETSSPGRFKRSTLDAPPVPPTRHHSTLAQREDNAATGVSEGDAPGPDKASHDSSVDSPGEKAEAPSQSSNLDDSFFNDSEGGSDLQEGSVATSGDESSYPRRILVKERHRRTRSVPEGPSSSRILEPALVLPAPASTAGSDDSQESINPRRPPLWAAVADLRTLGVPFQGAPSSEGTPPHSLGSASTPGSVNSYSSSYDSEPQDHDTPEWTSRRRATSILEPPGTVSTFSTQTIETPEIDQEERSMLPELKLTSPGRTETHVESEIIPTNARRLRYPSKYARRVPPQIFDESQLGQVAPSKAGEGQRSTPSAGATVPETLEQEESFSQDHSTYTRLGRQAVASISSLSSKASMEDLNRSIQRHQREERERIAAHARSFRESIDQAQRESEEKQPASSSFLPDISSLRLGRRRPSTAKSTQSSRSETAASCKSATPRPSLAASTTTSFSTNMPDTKADNFGSKAYRSLRTKMSGFFHSGDRRGSRPLDQWDVQHSPPPPVPKSDSATWARFASSKASRSRQKDLSDSDQSFGHDPEVAEERYSSRRNRRRERANTVVPSGKRGPIPETYLTGAIEARGVDLATHVGSAWQIPSTSGTNDPQSVSSSFVLLDRVGTGEEALTHDEAKVVGVREKSSPTTAEQQEIGLGLGRVAGKSSQTLRRSAPIPIPQRRPPPQPSADFLEPQDLINPFKSTLSSSLSTWSEANLTQSVQFLPSRYDSPSGSPAPTSFAPIETSDSPVQTKNKGKGRAKGERKIQDTQSAPQIAGGMPASSSLGSVSDEVVKTKDESKGFMSSMRSLGTWRKGASKGKKKEAIPAATADSESGNSVPSSSITGESPPL